MDKIDSSEKEINFSIASQPKLPKEEFEKLKLIYEKTAEHHKYYLSWRQFILSGFFAVIAVLLLCIYNGYTSPSLLIRCVTPLISIVIFLSAIFFESLDKRNKDLYQSCQRTATVIELHLFGQQLDWSLLSTKGLFFDLNKSFKLNELLKKDKLTVDSFVPEVELHNFTRKNYSSNATHSQIFDYLFYTIKLAGLIIFSVLAFKIWFLNRVSILNYFTFWQWTGLLITIFVPVITLTICSRKIFKTKN